MPEIGNWVFIVENKNNPLHFGASCIISAISHQWELNKFVESSLPFAEVIFDPL
jgi:hypothetical protein